MIHLYNSESAPMIVFSILEYERDRDVNQSYVNGLSVILSHWLYFNIFLKICQYEMYQEVHQKYDIGSFIKINYLMRINYSGSSLGQQMVS